MMFSIPKDLKNCILNEFLTTADIANFRQVHKSDKKLPYKEHLPQAISNATDKYSKLIIQFDEQNIAIAQTKKLLENKSWLGKIAFLDSEYTQKFPTILKNIIHVINKIYQFIFPFYKKAVNELQQLKRSLIESEQKASNIKIEMKAALQEKEKLVGERIIMDIFGGEEAVRRIPVVGFEDKKINLKNAAITDSVMKGVDENGCSFFCILADKLRNGHNGTIIPIPMNGLLIQATPNSGSWKYYGDLGAIHWGEIISQGKWKTEYYIKPGIQLIKDLVRTGNGSFRRNRETMGNTNLTENYILHRFS